MNDTEILENLKSIKEKSNNNKNTCKDCLYDNICDEIQGYPCDMYDDLMFLLKQKKKMNILNYLKLIKKECKETNMCVKCQYIHSCDIILGYPCRMYDDLMKLLNKEKKMNNRSDEDENL